MILRTRILALAALLAILFLSLIAYTLVFFSTASAELNHIVERSLTIEKTAEKLNTTILLIRSDIWDTMIFDREHRDDQVARLDIQARAFYQGLRDLAAADVQFASASQELRDLFQAYYQFGATLLELKSLEEFVGQGLLVQKFRQNQSDLLLRLAQTVAVSKEQFFGSMERLNDDFSRTTVTAFGLAGLVTLLSFAVALLMARRLTLPLERLTRTVRQVSKGNYHLRPELTSSGEIRALTETFIAMLDQIEDYSGRMEDLVRARTDALVRTNAVMVKELKLAQKIQDAFIPNRFPTGGPFSAAGAYLPMEDLGGDFYDVFEAAPGEWTLVMADVSGHGVPAALVTAMVKISLGLHGPQAADPGHVLEEVNRELYAAIGDLRRYVTMVLCHINMKAQTLSYCNAGHNELVINRRSGREMCGPNSGVVGLRPDEIFHTRTLAFHPGDSLLLFTDGLIEARGPEKTEFGLERLLKRVEENRSAGPAALVARLSADVQEFAAGQPRQDDIAVLAVKWEEAPQADPTRTESAESAVVPASASVFRAEAHYRAREIDQMMNWIEGRLAGTPGTYEVSRLHHWRAMGYHYRGAYSEARTAWDQALEADPENHRARRNRALLELHLQAGRP